MIGPNMKKLTNKELEALAAAKALTKVAQTSSRAERELAASQVLNVADTSSLSNDDIKTLFIQHYDQLLAQLSAVETTLGNLSLTWWERISDEQ